MSDKQKYRELCNHEESIPLPSRAWWLDAVAGNYNWDVVIIERDNQIIASLPYVLKTVVFFNTISMPKFTPSMGVWLKYPDNQKYHTKLSYEKKICTELIERLPQFERFHQRFHYSFTNWLPFFWKGFMQTTRYTYIINDLSDLEKVFSNFRENIRREIRKAQKYIKVYQEESVDKLYRLIQLTYERQNQKLDYSFDYFKGLDIACAKNKCCQVFYAEDENQNLHSALYLVWDENCAYYIIGGSDPGLRSSGAASLLMWEAIQFASTVVKQFNFCGSMIEPIERFFRSFGAIQKPYFSISKNNHFFKLLKLFKA